MSDRQQVFEQAIEEFDEKALAKCLDFAQHRFVSIERDPQTGATYVKGHKTLRGACGHLGRVVEGVEGYLPEKVLDLDTGEMHELDVFAFVAPTTMDGAAVLLSSEHWRDVLKSLRGRDETAHMLAIKAIERALERRSR